MVTAMCPDPQYDAHPRPRSKFTENLVDPERVVAALGIRPGQTILDAGCGTGYMAKHFARATGPTGKVLALDRDQGFLRRLDGETQSTCIETVLGDITTTTSLAADGLDLLYLSAVVHIFSAEQFSGFVNEAKRLLRPGALLAIVEIDKKETPFGPPLHLRYAPEELARVLPLDAAATVRVGEHFYMQVFRQAV